MKLDVVVEVYVQTRDGQPLREHRFDPRSVEIPSELPAGSTLCIKTESIVMYGQRRLAIPIEAHFDLDDLPDDADGESLTVRATVTMQPIETTAITFSDGRMALSEKY